MIQKEDYTDEGHHCFFDYRSDIIFGDSHILTTNISSRFIKKLIDDVPGGFGFCLLPAIVATRKMR